MSNHKKEVGPIDGIINHPFSDFVAYFPNGNLLNIYNLYSTLLYSTLLYSNTYNVYTHKLYRKLCRAKFSTRWVKGYSL